MKRLIVGSTFAAFLLTWVYPYTVPTWAAVIDSLQVFYPHDEASGNAIDAHSTHDLTETGGTIGASTGPGGLNGSRDFELADTEYFEVADHADLSTGDIDYSLQFWFNLESLGGGALYCIANKGWGSADSNAEWTLTVEEFGGDAYVTYRINNGGASVQVNTGTISLGTWMHFVAWHDSVANEIGVAINAGAPTTTAYSGGATDGVHPFQIGTNFVNSQYFDGLISQGGFWKKVLTSAERTWLYNSGNGRSYADIQAEAGASCNGGLLLLGAGGC